MRPRLSTRCPRTRELANLAALAAVPTRLAVPARLAVLPALLAVGCLFDLPPAIVVDGGMDGDSGGSNKACATWSPRSDVLRDTTTTPPSPLNVCAKAAPGPAWTVSGSGVNTYNTTDGTLNGGAGPSSFVLDYSGGYKLRVIFVQRLDVTARLRLIGEFPLVVVSWTDIAIAGEVNASSARVGGVVTPGAGSPRRSGCTPAKAGTGSSPNMRRDGGGGGGGGLGAGGGRGGNGQGSTAGGDGGGSIAATSDFAAGCDGALSPNLSSSSAAGGLGGGAVHLIAKSSITVAANARIHAGGSGGDGLTGTQSEGGGGGGGSGGTIGFDTPTLTIEARAVIAANGGGGGAGCEDLMTMSTGISTHGDDADPEGTAATGGRTTQCMNGSARGGAGSTGNAPGVVGVDTSGGGGGGGGGGFVLAWTPNAPVVPGGSTVTPPFIQRQ
jgi:hypothetical protein